MLGEVIAERCFDEAKEHRVWMIGLGKKLRVELTGDKEWVVGDLDNFSEFAVW